MGLLQKAYETYVANAAYVGVDRETKGTLCPEAHIIQKAALEIALDEEGCFLGAQAVPPEDSRTIIPATEKSASRTSGDEAHPLCDQLCYLSGEDENKHGKYLAGLRAWIDSPDAHPDLMPVLRYIQGGTILDDLTRAGLLTEKARSEGKKGDKAYLKYLVRWIIDGRRCWQNRELMAAYRAYAAHTSDAPIGLCMISGEEGPLCASNDKGITAANNGAKLISSNDSSGFTYRGRFVEAEQACTVSIEASQKAHRALQWVVASQGVVIGGRTFVCWNPQGKRVKQPASPMAKRATESVVYTSSTNYCENVKRTLSGYRNELPAGAGVVTAVFDAATTGRLALTYYSELEGNDFYKRLEAWYGSCCWPFGRFGIESPLLIQIANCAYGVERDNRIETDAKVLREATQRLLACMLNCAPVPDDIVRCLFHKAANPLHYQSANNRFTLLCTACAIIRKHHNDLKKKEEWTMELDENKNDRSYQFGRLLAVMEKAERSTYSKDETREPNAIRLQSVFNERPFHTAKVIEGRLNPYFQHMKSPALRSYYKNMIGEIMAMICKSAKESEWNRPLEDTYLMGYYLQRAALYTKKPDENDVDTEENDNEQV